MTHDEIVDQLPIWLVDFAQAFHDDPAWALDAVQLLLLDESECRRRVALLRRLAAQDERPGPREDISHECRTIGEFGVIDAVRQERITIERLLALIADPDALWQVHCALVEPPLAPWGETTFDAPQSLAGASGFSRPAPPSGETVADRAHKQATAGTFTVLARRGDWTRLADKLRPLLPVLLARLGLSETPADNLLDWIRAQMPQLGQRQFRDAVSDWIGEFVRRESGRTVDVTRDDWLAVVEQRVLLQTLQSIPDTAAPWARRWRDAVVERSDATIDDLLEIELPESSVRVPLLPDFRREVFAQARSRMVGAMQELEM